jgi:hypothetical protein
MLVASPAYSCGFYSARRWSDVRYADTIVLANIVKYELISEIPPEEQRRIASIKDPEIKQDLIKRWQLSPRYAKLTLRITDVIKGEAPSRLTVAWHNSTFQLPKTMPASPHFIALQIAAHGERSSKLPIILQASCSSPFMFEAKSEEGQIFKRFMAMVSYATFPWVPALILALCLWRRTRLQGAEKPVGI